jgi:hypothetical protein
MSDDVNIRISATDNATATLRAVQGELGKFSASIKSIAGLTIAGLGIRELGGFAADSFKAYAESERAVTMLDRVLKSTGNTIKMTRQEIQDYAEARMAQTTFDDDAIVEAASQLARFRDISGETFTASLDAAQDLATVMGTDLVAATQMLGRAMSSPADGLAKLAKAGVLFTDAQKEQIKQLDLIGDKAAQQRIILEELRRQFGGAAIGDASTASGQIKQLQNAIGELKETIGATLTPAVRDLIFFMQSAFPPDPTRAIRGLNRPLDNADNMTQGELWKRFQEQQAALNEARRQEVKLQESMQNRNTLLGDDGAFFGIQLGPTLAEQQAQLKALRQAIKEAENGQQFLARMIDPEFLGGNLDFAREIKQAASTAVFGAVTSVLSGAAEAATKVTTGFVTGRMAEVMATDAGSVAGRKLYGIVTGQQQKEERDTSLQATEARFLTRGRGQLSPEAKKMAEDNQKQLAELRNIRNAIEEMGEGILIVEGIV